MKILIFGKTGQVGQELISLFTSEDIAHKSISRNDCDYTNESEIESLICSYKPNIIINAAAYTAVDNAERNREEAKTINSEFPKILAKLSSKNSILLVHFSTDYIFNGLSSTPIKENEAPSPINYYGITKLDGENHIINHHDKYMILRTSWVYSKSENNFFKKIISLLKLNDSINVINDQHGVPTSARFLSKITLSLIKNYSRSFGIYNIVPNGKTTWYGFANLIKDSLIEENIIEDCKSIIPVSSDSYKTEAKRPLYSVLDNKKIVSLLKYRFYDWDMYVKKTIKELKS